MKSNFAKKNQHNKNEILNKSVYLTVPDRTFSFTERIPSTAEPIVPASIEIVPE